MSKRSNDSKDVLPAKRSRRPAGFRFARPPPGSSQPSASSSSNTSVFVTVSQPHEQRGNLQAETRVLSSQQGSTAVPDASLSSSTPESQTPPPVELDNWSHGEPPAAPSVQEETVKPKRKRYTTNAVCDTSQLCQVQVSKFETSIDLLNGSSFERHSSMRLCGMMDLGIFLVKANAPTVKMRLVLSSAGTVPMERY